uniref:Uncharacterized protein n=1 Tax=Oryza barthii TaxID=65489 RepID=A0A0D3EMR2_9ORYZ
MAAATDRAALLSAEVAPLLAASSSSSSLLVAAPGVDGDGATPGRLLIVIGGGGAGQGRGRSSLAVAVVPPEVTEPAAARSRSEGRKRERRGEEINMRRGEEEEIRMIKFEVLRGKRECWGEKKFVQERGIFTCGLLKWLEPYGKMEVDFYRRDQLRSAYNLKRFSYRKIVSVEVIYVCNHIYVHMTYATIRLNML